MGGGPPSKPFRGQSVGGVNQAHLPIAHAPSRDGRDWFQLDSQELSSLGNEFAKLVMPEPSPLSGLSPPFHECRQADDSGIVSVQDKECPIAVTSAAKGVVTARQLPHPMLNLPAETASKPSIVMVDDCGAIFRQFQCLSEW